MVLLNTSIIKFFFLIILKLLSGNIDKSYNRYNELISLSHTHTHTNSYHTHTDFTWLKGINWRYNCLLKKTLPTYRNVECPHFKEGILIHTKVKFTRNLVNVWIELKWFFSCVVHFSMGPVYCSWDPQVLYSAKKKNFKFGSYDTIHIFKNYFVTVFSIFSNKRYPNRPLDVYRHKFFCHFEVILC